MKIRLRQWGAMALVFGALLAAHDVITSRAAMWQWQKTSANNANADATINWAEGMPPAVVNDSARAMMARIAEWRDDMSGLLVTGGTSTAYTLTTNQGLPSPPNNGQAVCFVPNVTNGTAATLSADGGTFFALQASPGVAITPSSLIQGTPYCASYNSSSTAWILFGGVPTSVPLGTVLDYTGSSAPTSNFALAAGQAISRTTFAGYFALVGTTYGAGDGSTTFNIPDLRGRSVHGLDNMGGSAAGRIGTVTTDGGTIVGTTLGSAAGSATHAQTSAELAVHSHANSLTDPGHTHPAPANRAGTNDVAGADYGGGGTTQGQISVLALSATTGVTINNANAGSGNAMAIVSPTMMLNKIIRVQ